MTKACGLARHCQCRSRGRSQVRLQTGQIGPAWLLVAYLVVAIGLTPTNISAGGTDTPNSGLYGSLTGESVLSPTVSAAINSSSGPVNRTPIRAVVDDIIAPTRLITDICAASNPLIIWPARISASRSREYDQTLTERPAKFLVAATNLATSSEFNLRGAIACSKATISVFCRMLMAESVCHSKTASKNSNATPLTTKAQPSFFTSSGLPSFSRYTPMQTTHVAVTRRKLNTVLQFSRSSIDQMFRVFRETNIGFLFITADARVHRHGGMAPRFSPTAYTSPFKAPSTCIS